MADINLVRVPNGYAFADAEAVEVGKRHRLGERVRAKVVKPRSLPYHRKFFSLLQFAFDYWEPDDAEVPAEYRGMRIEKSFARFRDDVIVLAGFGTPVWNARGELRLVPRSIAWSEMDADEFDQLYKASIDVCMRLVMRSKGFTREALDRALEELEKFSG
jgi:hypothetical protein